jgi:two-component system, NtrC family, nitrogen regulation response regulator NtrX
MVEKEKNSVLIVDDEKDICVLVKDILEDEGYEVHYALTPLQFRKFLEKKRPDIVLLDICLNDPVVDGIQLLEEIKIVSPSLPVIVMSGHGTFEIAVSAIKKGAYDFVEKPFESDRLILTVKRSLENARLHQENVFLRPVVVPHDLIGKSRKVREIQSTIKKAAPTEARVCIVGEAGVGKKLISNLIHQSSGRSAHPFLRLDCTYLRNSSSLEKEFLGWESNGEVVLQSPFESAASGTLLLENIDQIPLSAQGLLIRLLENKKTLRVGGQQEIFFNPRIITTSQLPLEHLVKQGVFLSDLFYRLNIIPIYVPPLRERIEDLEMLLSYFGERIEEKRGNPMTFSKESIDFMKTYTWPGNVREVLNMVERIDLLFPHDREISVKMLPADLKKAIPTLEDEDGIDLLSLPLRDARNLFEKRYLTAQISRFNGSISRAAEFVGMERTAFHRKLKLLNTYTLSESNLEEKETQVKIEPEATAIPKESNQEHSDFIEPKIARHN